MQPCNFNNDPPGHSRERLLFPRPCSQQFSLVTLATSCVAGAPLTQLVSCDPRGSESGRSPHSHARPRETCHGPLSLRHRWAVLKLRLISSSLARHFYVGPKRYSQCRRMLCARGSRCVSPEPSALVASVLLIWRI
jgi:hypothetical protein